MYTTYSLLSIILTTSKQPNEAKLCVRERERESERERERENGK